MSRETFGVLLFLLAPVAILLALALAGLTGARGTGLQWEDGSASYPDGTSACLIPANGCTP